ncbi:MAG: alpha/beta fold hydrolase [Mycobacterium sp.]|nr:alpha/beta fold hydrolase [Mycobacterium sp.]
MTATFKNRTLEQRRQAVANLYDFVVRGGMADTTRTPSEVIDEGHKSTLHRYVPTTGSAKGDPVLFVPPLGSRSACFDLRRGCSLAEHFVSAGRPTYLVDYGEMRLSDRELGIEFWVSEVAPNAIKKVSQDAGGAPVHLVGWCLGGVISILTAAAYPDLPIKSVAMVASPFDVSKNPMVAPVRAAGKHTGGRIFGTFLKVLGGLPAQIVGPAFKATSLTTYLKKPITLLKHRDDREFLAQVEAVDGLMNSMLAYPGRATLQVYQRMVQRNELATGKVQGPNRLVDLADVRVPVLNIAGSRDVLVPVAVAHHVGELLPNSPEVRLETAPGGHLGVLTGRSAPATTWAMIDEFLDEQPA